MPLWKSTDQANSAPKFLGVLAKDKAYATQANVTTTGTFTQGSNVISSLGTTTGITVNQLISSSTVGANVSPGAIVTGIINSTAVSMSQTFSGTTASGASITFQYDGVRGYNLYNNTTPEAFVNNQTIGLFNILNIPNYVTITANTIAGNNILTNPSAGFSNTQTGSVSQGNAIMTVTSTANIVPGQSIYSTAANSTGGSPVWVNTGAYAAVANVINTTAVLLNATSPLTNSTASFYFSNIFPNMVAAGNNLPALASNNGTVSTLTTAITGTISNGTIGSNGNILNVTAFTGPALAVGQELLANATLGIANGTYIVSSTAQNGLGNYVVSANSISNGAAGATVSMSTVMPKVVSVNATAIVLSSNAYATGSATGNTVTFSSLEKTTFGRSVSAGWDLIKWGTGPVTSFSVNTTSTSGYSNGETVIVSGGSANALGVITTNTGSGQVGANISSVAVAYPGSGFTNTSVLSYTYQHQLHLANVTMTGTATGSFANGDTITVGCTYALASFTGVIASGILTASSVTGTISVGNLITGTGVTTGTQILAQLSGTAGGAGTYAVSKSVTVASTSMTSTGQIVAAVATVVNSAAVIANNQVNVSSVGLFTAGLTAANLVFTYSNAGGGTYTSGLTFAGSFATSSSGASVNAALGGRSGRIMTETIVALTGTSPYVSENAADNGTFPNS
jgi:hypothetical protein